MFLNPAASKSFRAECQVLRTVRHRNLVKLLTACSGVDGAGNEFKALVYEFEGSTPRRLSLVQRLNIAIDVASALESGPILVVVPCPAALESGPIFFFILETI
ncbi:Probable LRR receptor-like serine/threonine-protein kinase At3g47570 [Linum grandiflorum]